MNTPPPSSPAGSDDTAALFSYLVMQQASMATMLLGKTPHPETGQTTRDLDAARYFIDQLEMLEVKTKGNLTRDEAALLKQSLMNLRLAYVEAVEQPDQSASAAQAPKSGETPQPAEAPRPAEPSKSAEAPRTTEEEHRIKFSKRY